MTSAGRDDDDDRRYDDEATIIDPAVRRAIAAMSNPSEPHAPAPPDAVLVQNDPSDADPMIDRARGAVSSGSSDGSSSEASSSAPPGPGEPVGGRPPHGGGPAQESAGGCGKGCAVVALVLVLLAVGSSLIAAVIGIAGVVIGGGSLAYMVTSPKTPTVAPTERSAPELEEDEQPAPDDDTDSAGLPESGDAPAPDDAAPPPRP